MTNTRLDAPSTLLEPDEIELLRRALSEWGGPAHASDQMARGMGFAGAEDLLRQCRSLQSDLRNNSPIADVDWARILLATEIVFASDLMGSGTEWRTTTGIDDESTIRLIRAIQRKLNKVLRPYYGKTPAALMEGNDAG